MKTRLKLRRLTSTALLLGLSASTGVLAQRVENRDAGGSSQDDVVELSPFTVNSERDTGYFAENTLAGSRLNTPLRDTASSVSVLTKQFLDDLAITDLSALLDYTVNSEADTNAWQAELGQNPAITGENLLNRTMVRGLAASQGMDYFTNITNGDPYRVGRFEDTRGPNSILFGVGAPGGLLNQSSKVAVTHADSATVRYGFGSFERNRLEVDANKVLKRDRIAVSIAAVAQENGGWRQFDFQDKKRIFGAVTFRPLRTLTVQAMGETGHDAAAVLKTTPPADEFLAWYDNRAARGVDAVTVIPTTAAPNAALTALGITGRNGSIGGQNRRAVYIENDGRVFDAIGTYVTGSYNNVAVRAPDGTPGVTGSSLLINDPAIYPRSANAGGPGMSRRQALHNYTLIADWQPVKNLTVNVAQNYQQTNLISRVLVGTDPTIRGEPNRTLGINGPQNPYVGQLYFDGNWRGNAHYGDYRESRASISYAFGPKWKWIGRQRLAASWSKSDQTDINALSWLSLAGRPFNAVANNANNRITVRNYAAPGDLGSYRVGDWRSLPASVAFGGRNFETAFVNDAAGGGNSGMRQGLNSWLGVLQSYFWQDRVATTFGYREDKVKTTQFGYYTDSVIGDVVDQDSQKAVITNATARTLSVGGVVHVTDYLSLIANRSTNVGVPPLARTVYPFGNLAPLSKGKGEDYGIDLSLLEGRVNARLVYFTASEKGRITGNGLSAVNTRVMDAFASVLVGSGQPFSPTEWASIYRTYTPPVNAISSDFMSEGYEARITMNLTANWRLIANYSYTDSGRKNLANEMVAWFGIEPGDKTPLRQGVRQDTSGRYVVDVNAFTAGGTIAKWIELGNMRPAANLSTLTTGTGSVTVAEEVFNLIDSLNENKQTNEKRWGVRPHKVSFFSAYDFKEGGLKGFTAGAGWRWRSANVIGSDSSGREITGRSLAAADMMIGYSMKLHGLPGRVRLQVNVSNVFDETDIIPVRLSTSDAALDGFMLPGGRGIAYSRYDLVAPREVRFTTTYSF